MVQFIVRDYQAVKEAKVTVNGITVIRGASNGGKSSFFQAIEAANTNRFKAGCVRYGSSYSEVKEKFDDSPNVLTVQRKETGSPLMKLANQSWSKLNRDLPNEVLDFTRFGSVQVSPTEKYSLNFFNQFQKPLLMEFTQKKVMEILSVSKASEDRNKLQKEIDLRRAKNRGAFDSIDAVLTETKVAIALNDDLLKDLEPLTQAEVYVESIYDLLKKEESLNKLKSLIVATDIISRELAEYRNYLSLADDIEKLNSSVVNLETLYDSIKKNKILCSELELLKQIKLYSGEVECKSKSLSDLNSLFDSLQNSTLLTQEVHWLKLAEGKRGNIETCETRIWDLVGLKSHLVSISSLKEELEQLIPQRDLIVEKSDLKTSIGESQNRINSLLLLITYLDKYEALKKEIKNLELTKTTGVCVFCKRIIE
jgi:DNA repair ATPase RecN